MHEVEQSSWSPNRKPSYAPQHYTKAPTARPHSLYYNNLSGATTTHVTKQALGRWGVCDNATVMPLPQLQFKHMYSMRNARSSDNIGPNRSTTSTRNLPHDHDNCNVGVQLLAMEQQWRVLFDSNHPPRAHPLHLYLLLLQGIYDVLLCVQPVWLLHC